MPDTRHAERLLSLVMPTDRAASIVGDLTENTSGSLPFWTSIGRIAFSMVWKEMRARPGEMAYVAVGGAVMIIGLLLAFGVAIFISWVALMVGAQVMSLWTPSMPAQTTNIVFALLVLAVAIPAPYMAGRWIGRRAPGQEFAASTAFGLFAIALWIAAVAVFGNNIELLDTLYGVAPTAAYVAVTVAGQYAGAIHARSNQVAWEQWAWFEKFPFDRGFHRTGSRWRASATGEQKYLDIFMLLVVAPPAALGASIELSSPGARLAMAVALWAVAAVYAGQAVVTHPLQWIRPGNRLIAWLGRILFAGIAVGIAALALR